MFSFIKIHSNVFLQSFLLLTVMSFIPTLAMAQADHYFHDAMTDLVQCKAANDSLTGNDCNPDSNALKLQGQACAQGPSTSSLSQDSDTFNAALEKCKTDMQNADMICKGSMFSCRDICDKASKSADSAEITCLAAAAQDSQLATQCKNAHKNIADQANTTYNYCLTKQVAFATMAAGAIAGLGYAGMKAMETKDKSKSKKDSSPTPTPTPCSNPDDLACLCKSDTQKATPRCIQAGYGTSTSSTLSVNTTDSTSSSSVAQKSSYSSGFTYNEQDELKAANSSGSASGLAAKTAYSAGGVAGSQSRASLGGGGTSASASAQQSSGKGVNADAASSNGAGGGGSSGSYSMSSNSPYAAYLPGGAKDPRKSAQAIAAQQAAQMRQEIRSATGEGLFNSVSQRYMKISSTMDP